MQQLAFPIKVFVRRDFIKVR